MGLHAAGGDSAAVSANARQLATVVCMATDQTSAEPAEFARSGSPERDRTRPNWAFARQPFWVFSHLFALSMVSLFVVLGLWQLDRLEQRRDNNQIVEARTSAQPLVLDVAPTGDDLEFRPATIIGFVVDDDVARIANRSQGGVAGEHVVAVVELSDGNLLAVNRGFVPINADVALTDLADLDASGGVQLSGWLRNSVEPEGWFAVTDTGVGPVMPRLDTEALGQRLDRPVSPVWLQMDDRTSSDSGLAQFPDPVPLPELGEGPHLSYAGQWFIFAVLGVGFYLATVRRRAYRDQ